MALTTSSDTGIIWVEKNNFGDLLTPLIVRHLSARDPVRVEPNAPVEHFVVVGSTLHFATPLTTVWGTGIICGRTTILPNPRARVVLTRCPPRSSARPSGATPPPQLTISLKSVFDPCSSVADFPERFSQGDESPTADTGMIEQFFLGSKGRRPSRLAPWLFALLFATLDGLFLGSIHLQLEELGIHGPAQVLSLTSCPPLAERPSDGHHLVIGKFAHSADNVVDLHIEGLDQSIGTTTNHPFWSADREEFVQAGDLRVGEHVLSLKGALCPVTRLEPRVASQPLFNLEVEAEHVYHISETGIVVHNECCSAARKAFWKYEAQENAAKYSADNLARMNAGRSPQITVQARSRSGDVSTRNVSLELHHRSLPQRMGASQANEAWDLVLVTPWAHEAMDPFRHTGNELVKVLRGVNGWVE